MYESQSRFALLGRRRQRGLALLLATACPVLSAPYAAATTATPSRTQTPAYTPGPSTIYGRVATNGVAGGCTGGRPGVTVRLDPGSRSTVTSESGEFVFEDVPFGEYRLHVEPDCEPLPCYASDPFVLTNDTSIALCYEDCGVALLPAGGVPGTVVDVSGYCYPVSGERLELFFDDELVGEAATDAAGLYRTALIVPDTANPDFSHRVRVVVDGNELAAGYFSIQAGPQPCVGDCDGNFAVTVDELVQGVRAALGFPGGDCTATDSTGDGTVTVAELIAAVGRALDGCHAADLVPTEARISRCADSCSTLTARRLFVDVCVANRGDFDAPGFNILSIQQDGLPGAFAAIFGLAPGEETCVEMPITGDGSIVVDPYQVVPERDETNNALPVAVGTACDVIVPPCTGTPSPRPTPT
jgi:hypothetical protein